MLLFRSLGTTLILAAFVCGSAGADPVDYTPLGTLTLTTGAHTLDTDALTIVDEAAPGTPLFTGLIDDQGGLADSYGRGAR